MLAETIQIGDGLVWLLVVILIAVLIIYVLKRL
jgi:hypothetical protein